MPSQAHLLSNRYDIPLVSALKQEISGNFLRAATAWCLALADPTNGLEDKTAIECFFPGCFLLSKQYVAL